jgi:Lon protease-like protein
MICDKSKARCDSSFQIAARDLPEIIPIFPLSGVMLLPRGRLPLNIFEPCYIAMVEHALTQRRMIGMIQPSGEASLCGKPKVFQVGCAGRIHSFNETEDGRLLISLIGVSRFRVAEETGMQQGFRNVRADWSPFLQDLEAPKACLIDRDNLIGHIRNYFQIQGLSCELELIEKSNDEKLITSLAMVCPFTPCEKQALLEAPTMEARCKLLITLMDMAPADRDDSVCDYVKH